MLPWKSVTEPPSPAPQWNPMQWDAIAQYYPWRVFYARSMRGGHIPLWNPYQFRGTPFLANGQSAVLYPPNLIYLVLDPITAVTAYAALHLFLAMAFMYLLLRELGRSVAAGILGAVTFAFSAFMVLWLELPTFMGAAVWLPLALLLIHRAVEPRSVFYGMLAGAVLALSFLAGHFQIAFYVLLAALLWWLWKLIEVLRAEGQIYATLRVVVPLLACLATLALIAAPQVLPTVELARESHRVRDVTSEGYAKFIANALKPYRLVTAFVPGFFGDPSKNNYYLLGGLDGHIGSAADYMEYGMYAGILPLILAGIGIAGLRRVKYAGFFALLALLALLVAIGTPLNALFYYLIPGFSALGGPNRMLVLYLFGVAGLAAFGFDMFTERATEPSRFVYVRGYTRKVPIGAVQAFAALIIVGLAASLISMGAYKPFPAGTQKLVQHVGRDAWDPFMNLALACLAVLWLRAENILRGKSFAVVAIAVLVADLFAFGINYNPTCERSKVYPRTQLTDQLKRVAGTGRIAPINSKWSLFQTPEAILPPNAAMVYGLYDVQGYDSLYTRSYKDRLDEIEGTDSSPIENGNMVLVKAITPQLRQVASLVLTTQLLDTGPRAGLAFVDQIDGVRIYRIVAAQQAREQHRYEPFTFRFGLYLMFIGVAALGCVGAYRAARFRNLSK